MYQGTTPSYALEIAGYDLTVEGANKQFTLSGDRLTVTYDSENDKTTIVFSFTQAETFQLPVGTLKCQARWVDENDEAWATEEASLMVNSVLLKKVITRAEEEDEDADE